MLTSLVTIQLEIPKINIIKHIENQAMEIEATNTANKQEVKSESEVLLSDFAKNLVEQMFVEALEEYQERKRKNVHDKLPISSKTNPGIAGGQSSGEFTSSS